MSDTPNLKERLASLSKRERNIAFNEIIESQNRREFQETANALKNLEPTESENFGYKMVRLVGDTWEAAAQMAPAYKKHNLGKEISSLLIMLGDCTKGAIEAYGELHDIVSKKRHDDLYQEGLELRISKEFYTFVHLAFSLIDVIRIYKNEAIRLRNDPALEDKFQALLTVHYADKFNHLFIKEMRNNLSHVNCIDQAGKLATTLKRVQSHQGIFSMAKRWSCAETGRMPTS